MSKLKLEQTVDRLIEGYNIAMEAADIPRSYRVDIRERERFVNVSDPNDKKQPVKIKKQYYATLCLLMDEEVDGIKKTYLLWRQEYVWFNLTEKTKEYLWRERLSEGLLYESLGVFTAVAFKEYTNQVENNDPRAGVYDLDSDKYIVPQTNNDGLSKEEHTTEVH